MRELGLEKFIDLVDKITRTMTPISWKVLNSNLLLSSVMGAAIGGAIAVAVSFLFIGLN